VTKSHKALLVLAVSAVFMLLCSIAAHSQTWTDPSTGITYSIEAELTGSLQQYEGGVDPLRLPENTYDYLARLKICNTSTNIPQGTNHGAIANLHYSGSPDNGYGENLTGMSPWTQISGPDVLVPGQCANFLLRDSETRALPVTRDVLACGSPAKTTGEIIRREKIEHRDYLRLERCDQYPTLTVDTKIGLGTDCGSGSVLSVVGYDGQVVEYTVCIFVRTDADFVMFGDQTVQVENGEAFFIDTRTIQVGQEDYSFVADFVVKAWEAGLETCHKLEGGSYEVNVTSKDVPQVPALSNLGLGAFFLILAVFAVWALGPKGRSSDRLDS
jgi:hypothetical protein